MATFSETDDVKELRRKLEEQARLFQEERAEMLAKIQVQSQSIEAYQKELMDVRSEHSIHSENSCASVLAHQGGKQPRNIDFSRAVYARYRDLCHVQHRTWRCLLSGMEGEKSKDIICAHIIPHSRPEVLEPSRFRGCIDSPLNGMLLHRDVEYAMDRGWFCVVHDAPTTSTNSNADMYDFNLIFLRPGPWPQYMDGGRQVNGEETHQALRANRQLQLPKANAPSRTLLRMYAVAMHQRRAKNHCLGEMSQESDETMHVCAACTEPYLPLSQDGCRDD